MEEKIYELIATWARVPTWFTSHGHDERRFKEAILDLIDNLGTEIPRSDFKAALKRHADNTVPMLGMPNDFSEIIEKRTSKAFEIINNYGKVNDMK
ncbi:MAG: hypothetical protein AB2809_06555 [Candidatus Thiodiazotropha sp.]